jgi:hypothetical protein
MTELINLILDFIVRAVLFNIIKIDVHRDKNKFADLLKIINAVLKSG